MVGHRYENGVIYSTWDEILGVLLVIETRNAINAVGGNAVVCHFRG
jgi:hypothetical protein